MNRGKFSIALGCFMKALLTLAAFGIAVFTVFPLHAQAIRFPRADVGPPARRPAVVETPKPAEDSKDDAAVDVPRAAAAPLGPRHIRLHLLDGSLISGDLSVSEISVDTAFGKLVVPIDRVRSF